MSEREEFKKRILVSFEHPFDGDEFASKYIDEQTESHKVKRDMKDVHPSAFEAETWLHIQEEDGLIK